MQNQTQPPAEAVANVKPARPRSRPSDMHPVKRGSSANSTSGQPGGIKPEDKAQILKEAQDEFGNDDGEDEAYELDYDEDEPLSAEKKLD